MDPRESMFLTAELWVPVCFDISRYLRDKYFDIVLGHPPGDPQMDPQQTIFLTAQA